MDIKYRIVVIDNKITEEQYFENVCCEDMKKALLSQETTFAKMGAILWLYCPFCKEEINY